MSNPSLATVATHVVDQYSVAGKTLNQAYRATVERVLGNAKARFVTALEARSIPMVNDKVKSQLVNAQDVLAGFMLKGVQTAYDRADQAIDAIATRTNSGIQSVDSTVTRVESAFKIANLDAVRALAAPAASLASQIADKAVEGAKAVEARIGAVAEEMTEVAVAAKPARRAVRKA
ncbi:hypothetical protein [Variovorax sp. dw_954]|uniref:hypothetical protein n=1 Tax=Variovorax sp. dw_954 TaxID=2720078 RepID=UPI001BD5F5F4|nr:hypothetical protein [Variovorax sp. dw_954]